MMSKERFDKLAEGLLFQSETDAPLTYYELDPGRPKQWPPSTADQFLQLIGEPTGTSVEKLAPEKLFRNLGPGNEDRVDQVAALEKAMTTELRNLAGFRVGEIEIHIYVLGQDDSGQVVGLQTLSVET
jgi:nuclease A inhibitor-like protein